MHDLAPFRSGQAMIAAGVPVGQLIGRRPKQVQDRGVQVAEVDLAFDGLRHRFRSVLPWT